MTTTIGPDEIAQRLSALNYVSYVYHTGAEQGMLSDAIKDRDFAAIVSQAARTTRRRKQAYVFSEADVQAAARTANSWSLLASADGFLIGRLEDGSDQTAAVFAIKPDGAAASLPQRQMLDGDPGAAPDGPDVADSVATVSKDQPWTMSVTSAGHLVFRFAGQLKFAVLADGRAWAAGPGFLKTERPFAYNVAPELRRVWPPQSAQSAYAGWHFSISYGGEFVIGKDAQTILVFDADGSIWNAGAGGRLAAHASSAATAPAPSGAALAVAGAIGIGGATYNSAAGWVTGSAYAVGDWFKGAAGSVEDGFDSVGGFTQATAADAARWLSGAGTDAGHAISDAAGVATQAATAAANAAAAAAAAAANAAARAAEDAARETARGAEEAARATARAAEEAAHAVAGAATSAGRALDPTHW